VGRHRSRLVLVARVEHMDPEQLARTLVVHG